MHVNDYMSLAVIARAEESYIHACSLMQEHAIDHIPVVNESDAVISVLSRHDARLAASHFNIGPIEAGEVASTEPVMIEKDAPLTAAVEAMMARQVEVLVVTDDKDQVVGVLTSRDLHHALLNLLTDASRITELGDSVH